MKLSFDIRGDKELMAKLDSLPKKIEKRVIRTASRMAQKAMVPVAKANAQTLVGGEMGNQIAKAVQVRTARKQRKGSYRIAVRLKSGIESFVYITESGKRHFIPAAIEYGHLAGQTYVQPIPFMRSAADNTVNERMRVFREQLRIGLLREAIKNRV